MIIIIKQLLFFVTWQESLTLKCEGMGMTGEEDGAVTTVPHQGGFHSLLLRIKTAMCVCLSVFVCVVSVEGGFGT